MQNTIIIIEDKESMAGMLKEAIESEGYKTIVAINGSKGIESIKNNSVDLVLTDLKLPDKDGMEILKAVKDESPLTPVIIMTAFGSIETAVNAIKEGAFDFITKPFDIDHLLVLIGRAIQNQRLITENTLLKEQISPRTIIGKSQAIKEVAKNIQKVASTKTTVLLTGESGTGKELFARAIHFLSPRKEYPFVPINCAAIPAGLLESELFGHEKGSFTGAEARKLGKFELAQKGTVFLDEIGDLDIKLQGKLLRVIQEGELERVGGTKSIKTDVRIIAATNKDIEQAVSEGRFRDDLYYRLSVFPIRIPPLRDRKDDIPLLTEYFINKFCSELKTKTMTISSEAMGLLMSYDWKGNVRELENTIERAIILAETDVINPEHVTLRPILGPLAKQFVKGCLSDVAKSAVKTAEAEFIRAALQESGGNKSKAANILKVSYKTLLTKIKEYEIN